MSTSLDTALQRYKAAIENLQQPDSCEIDQVLEIFSARDGVQTAFKNETSIPAHQLKQIIELDLLLRKQSSLITTTINSLRTEQLAQWRECLNPTADAWWWRWETLKHPHPWNRFDCLWRFLAVAVWTANLSLLVNIAMRFLSGGVGLGGAAAVGLPGLFVLLQANSELTKEGQQGFDTLLQGLKIPQQFREEAKLFSTLIMSIFLGCIWAALPLFSDLYYQNGTKNHEDGNLGQAEQDYLQAISLNRDNFRAHYSLGSLYQNWKQLDKAKQEYQLAVAGNFPEAYNNLAHLYIQDKKYSQAATLLNQGLVLAKKQNSLPEVRQSLFKNLGWVRLEQGRYDEASESLHAAIGIASNPETAQYIPHPGSAHCLLAQVLDKQKQSAALGEWQKCCALSSTLRSDEDTWLHLAHEKLAKGGRECTEK